MKHPIPDSALDDRLAFVGTTGSGKTYAACTVVERILTKKGRVIIPDPLGVWWGLRAMADGKTESPYQVIIFGGPHGDFPITEHAGALIGETAAGMVESCIVDLSELGSDAAERRFMLAFLTALYKHASKEPVHVVFDEADMWAPERILDRDGDAAKLLNRMNTIVRRGRVRGFLCWLITQRSAVISKNLLSMSEGLITFKLTSPQDSEALGEWVKYQADKTVWPKIREELAGLDQGQGVVWLPHRKILETKQFPKKLTFDSSRTPKRGEKKRTTKLKPLNLDKLKDKLATVEAETKANDPAALRRQVADLQAALRTVKTPTPAPAPASKPDVSRREDVATITALRKALEAAMKFIVEINASNFFNAGGEAIDKVAIEKAIADASAQAVKIIEAKLERRNTELDKLRRDGQSIIGRLKTILDQDVTVKLEIKHNEPFTVSSAAKTIKLPREPLAPGDGSITSTMRETLCALAWWPTAAHRAPTKKQLAGMLGIVADGSTMRSRLAALTGPGLIEYPEPGRVSLTDAGAAAAPAPDMQASLVETIRASLTSTECETFDAIPANPAEVISREDLGAMLGGIEPAGSTMRSRLANLSTREIIRYPSNGYVARQEWVIG